MSEPLIVLKGVKKAYRTPAGDFYALKGIDLEIGAGEFVAMLGRSGAGKSTLVNMLTGIDRPTEGEIWIAGEALHRMSEAKLTRARGRRRLPIVSVDADADLRTECDAADGFRRSLRLAASAICAGA